MQKNRTRTGQDFTHRESMKGACNQAKWQLCGHLQSGKGLVLKAGRSRGKSHDSICLTQ